MASLHTAGNSAGSSNAYVCQTCSQVLKSERTLLHHNQTHNKQYRCSDCGELFARGDQVKVHQQTKHGKNTSHFICYMADCTRSGLGLTTKDLLVIHLQKCQQTATLADNEQATADSSI
ncbi:hypothetical protein PG994_003120 [Apiospora phragmitis]|uniref:C2H2-type domain-containing protein n=1 Tax=Apiospora phragmitis TaxID=2905665 RepID=A0ABR1W774_9PEZI